MPNDDIADHNRRKSDQHDNHENRLSVVEKQIEFIDKNVQDTRKAVDEGFTRVFQALTTNATEAHTQRNELNRRIDDHESSSKLTWPAIVALVAASVLIGGVMVGYVNLAIMPLRMEVNKASESLQREMGLRSELQQTHVLYLTKDNDRMCRKVDTLMQQAPMIGGHE